MSDRAAQEGAVMDLERGIKGKTLEEALEDLKEVEVISEDSEVIKNTNK